jgi:hypothetical protein
MLLALNVGSSSLKFALYVRAADGLAPAALGLKGLPQGRSIGVPEPAGRSRAAIPQGACNAFAPV